eukprot:TRINITY_DN22387_c0_g1_i1.p1 TRINITY_DN22387_c0_g1~~TRINITY_DN22387_c0_g1_i1.p1  ORF type:complete len:181 (+),score=39.19 TRINITY_DN22387_c0_g1_i1:44-586(+)
MPIKLLPFNFNKWIEEHRHLLKPPVGAKLVFEDAQFIIQVVGGPNRRIDYHQNMTEEFFYQLQGDMVLKVVDDGEFKDLPIKEGEIFLLPSNIPHSPQRFPNTVGLVIEQKRRPEHFDKLMWFCDNCKEKLFEETFHVDSLDLGKSLSPIIEKFYGSEEVRTCKSCKHITIPPPKPKADE